MSMESLAKEYLRNPSLNGEMIIGKSISDAWLVKLIERNGPIETNSF